MPSKRIERLRLGHDAFSRGDRSFVRELVAEDADWGTTGVFPGVESAYRGQAVETWMDALRSAWETFEVSLEEVLAEGDDLLVVTERIAGRGRESGIEVEMRAHAVYWFDDEGRICRRRAFTEPGEALSAAGLTPPHSH